MTVLLLVDESGLGRFLARALSEEGLSVDMCERGPNAIARARDRLYDLAVLDSTADGLTVCRELRRLGVVAPVLILVTGDQPRERVLALEAGADACMVKPIEVDEFVARVRAMLRRAAGFGALRCGDLAVDRAARQAHLAGSLLPLTNREWAILVQLLQRGGRPVRRSDLLAHVWGMRFDPGSNLVEVYVGRLRHKLGERAWMIETVRGVGYRLRGQKRA